MLLLQAMLHAPTTRMFLSSGFRLPQVPLLPSRWSVPLSIQTPVRTMSPNSSLPRLLVRKLPKVPYQQDNPRHKGPLRRTGLCSTSSRPSMRSLRRQPLHASLHRLPLISKLHLSSLRTAGRLQSSTLSASLWITFSSNLAARKHLSHLPLRLLFLISILPRRRHLSLTHFNPRPLLVRSLRSLCRHLRHAVHHPRSHPPFAGIFRHPNPLLDRKSVLLFHICLRA